MSEDGRSPTTIAGQLDLSTVPPWERRRRALDRFDSLRTGQVLRLTGGPGLGAVHQALAVERSGLFRWEWTEQGPERWTAYVERLPVGSLYTLWDPDPV